MREYVIEDAFRDEVARRGGLALKFTSQTMNGLPDRLVLLLGGKTAFVELKAPGKTMRPLQVKRKEQLESLGFPVFCVDGFEQILPVLDAIASGGRVNTRPAWARQIPSLERVEYPAFRETTHINNASATRSRSLAVLTTRLTWMKEALPNDIHAS
jgi:hypothetical protein